MPGRSIKSLLKPGFAVNPGQGVLFEVGKPFQRQFGIFV